MKVQTTIKAGFNPQPAPGPPLSLNSHPGYEVQHAMKLNTEAGVSVARANGSRRPHLLRNLGLVCALALTLGAQTPFYLGTWRIQSSARAPWATPADRTKALTGNITFSAKRITAPGLIACRELKYDLATIPPDGLFQGMLGEGNTAATAARKLGFGLKIESLSTGCEHSIDFHFFNHQSGAFALDNLIYRMKKLSN